MAGCFERNDARGAYLELFFIRELDIRVAKQFVRARYNPRARHRCQGSRTKFKIFLAVRFEDIGDAQIVFLGEIEIFIDIAPRVDYYGETFPAPEQDKSFGLNLTLSVF